MPLELWMSAESFHAHLKEQEIFEEWKGVLVSFFHSRYMQMSNWLPPGTKLREQDMAPLGLEQIPGREKIFLDSIIKHLATSRSRLLRKTLKY